MKINTMYYMIYLDALCADYMYYDCYLIYWLSIELVPFASTRLQTNNFYSSPRHCMLLKIVLDHQPVASDIPNLDNTRLPHSMVRKNGFKATPLTLFVATFPVKSSFPSAQDVHILPLLNFKSKFRRNTPIVISEVEANKYPFYPFIECMVYLLGKTPSEDFSEFCAKMRPVCPPQEDIESSMGMDPECSYEARKYRNRFVLKENDKYCYLPSERLTANLTEYSNACSDSTFILESKGSDSKGKCSKREAKYKTVVKVVKPLFILESEEQLFTDFEYFGIEVPSSLFCLKVADVPMILGSLSKSALQGEAKRGYASFRHCWSKDADSFHQMKMFLIKNYTHAPSTIDDTPTNYVIPENIYFCHDNKLFMDPIGGLHFAPRKGKKDSFEPPLMWRGTTLNLFYDLMLDPVKSRMLPPKRLKSILRNICVPEATLDDVISCIKGKCYHIKSVKSLKPGDLSWVHPYLSLEWYYVGFDPENENTVKTLFVESLTNMRNKILDFCKRYYDLSRMLPYQRKAYFRDQSEVFVEHLRSPAMQVLFANGVPRQAIFDTVVRNHSEAIAKRANNGVTMVKFVKRKLKIRSVNRNRSYDEKYASLIGDDFDNGTFVVESLDPTIVTFILLCFIFPYLYGVQKTEAVLNEVADKTGELIKDVGLIVDQQVSSIRRSTNSLLSAVNPANPQGKLLFLEVKTVIHILYHLYNDEYMSALSWGSNFLVTRGIEVIDIISSVNISSFKSTVLTNPVITYEGKKYTIQRDRYPALLEAYNTAAYERCIKLYGSEVTTESLSSICDVFSKLLATLNLADMDEYDIRSANNQFAYVNHFKKNMTDSVQSMTTIISVVSRTIFNYDPFDNDYNEFIRIITTTTQRISKYAVLGDDIANNKATLDDILKLYDETLLIMNNPRLESANPQVRNLIAREFVVLEGLARRAKQFLKGTSSRCEPLFVLFTGPPKVGKTATTNYLKVAISHLTHEPYSHEQTYNYNGGEYWEGYRQQRYVVMDDFLKDRDMSLRAQECKAVIDMVNTSTYNLNMAFGDKGCNFFDSPYIFASTNCANEGYDKAVWNTNLVDSTAMTRRFGLVLHRSETLGYEYDLINATFTIHKCNADPGLVGRVITVRDLAPLVVRLKALTDAAHRAVEYTPDYLSRIYPIEPQNINIVPESLTDIFPNLFSSDKPDINDNINFARKPESNSNEPGRYGYVVDLFNLLERPTVAAYAVGTLTLLSTFVAAYTVYTYSSTVSKPESKDLRQATGSGKRKKSPYKSLAFRKMGTFSPQSSSDSYLQSLLSTISRGTFVIKARSTSSSQTAMGFHIKDRMVCVPAHFYIPVDEGDEVTCVICIQGNEIPMEWPKQEDVIKVDDEDMIIFVLPSNIPMLKSLYPYMISSSDKQVAEYGNPVELVSADSSGRPIVKPVNRGNVNKNVNYNAHGFDFVVEHPISYLGPTEAGDSGSVVTVCGPQGRPVLIGMHIGKMVTGKANIGIAIPLCKEFFDELSGEFVTQSCEFPLDVLYTVPISESHYPPTKTKLKRSSLYECFGPSLKRPAVLNAGPDAPNVIFKAIAKMHQVQTPTYPFNKDRLMNYLQHVYPRSLVAGKRAGVVSYDEALRGDTVKGSLSICYNTSAGYGYSKGKKGKTSYLIQNSDLSYDYDPEFYDSLLGFENELLCGRNIDVLWCNFLKDELRLHAKVDEQKTRVVSGCQLHFLFLVRRYFLDLITHTHGLCASKPIATGLNVHSLQYSELYYRLKQTDGSVIAGDFSNFDGKLPKYIGEVVIEFINWWYDDGEINASVRKLLAHHIYNATHIVYDKVYQVVDGNPSGNPITTLYNSLCNLAMCYIILVEDFNVPEDSFNMTMYGDDNVITVNKLGLRVCDFSEHFMKRFDILYTHFSKLENDDYDTMETISYLGRKFVLCDSVIKAPLDLSTILQSVYYISGDEPEETILIDTSRSFFMELSHHGLRVFNKYSVELVNHVRNRLPRILKAVEYILSSKSYYAYHNNMYFDDPPGTFVSQSKGHTDCDCIASSTLKRTPGTFVPQSRDIKPNEVNFPEYEKTTNTDGSQFTDRHVNEPVITQQVQLGGYLDASQLESTAVDGTIKQNIHKECNMETFTMDRILNREYIVADVAWTGADAAGVQLTTVSHPGALLDQPFIAEKLDDFQYFRAGMRVSVRVVCNRFTYGKIVVFFRPNPNEDYYVLLEQANLQRASGDPHILVSAAATEAAIFDCPFISPKRAYQLQSGFPNELGMFIVKVFNPLTSCTNVVPEARVVVTAQFLDAEVFFPTSVVLESKSEQIVKSKQGIISSSLETVDSALSYVENVPFVSSYVNTFRTFSRPAAAIAKVLGLSKPTSLQSTQITKINPFSDMANGKGVDLAPKLCMDPENRVSVMPSIGGISVDEMSLVHIAGTPKLFEQVTLTSTSEGHLDVFKVSTGADHMGFFDFIANNFVAFSGSIKIKIYFTASLMQSARIVFYVANIVNASWMQCYHQVVDVTGDTEYEVTLPYPFAAFAYNREIPTEFSFYYKVLGWSQPDPSLDNPIYMNVYRAAADDVRFYGQIEREYTFAVESNPRADFSKAFPPIHASIKGFIPENVIFGEEHTNLREMLHKYYPYSTVTNGTFKEAFKVAPYSGGTVSAGFEMLSMMHAYYSGSTRHKYILDRNTVNSLNLCYGASVQDNYIGTSIASTVNPLVEAELPFFNNRAYISTRNPNDPNLPYSVLAAHTGYLFKASGDDFNLHFLSAFPPGTFGDAPSTRGYRGFRAFCSAV